MNKKYFDSRKGSVEATINTIRSEQKTIVKEEPKVSLQPKSYFGQKKDSLADAAAKVVSEDTNIYIGNDKKEDTDIDSVNDVALKNAEKSKSKDKDTKESKALTKEEQYHIKKEFGIKYEALSPEKQKQMDQLMKDFLARGGKIKKLKPGIAKGAGHLDKRGPYKADMLKGPKKHLAAQKDNSDELAGGKTATGQKVSKVDTRPNIREV